MQIQPIGHRIRGFYRVTGIGHGWEMNDSAQSRINALRFQQTYGTAAAVRLGRPNWRVRCGACADRNRGG